jgi:spermidine synthase
VTRIVEPLGPGLSRVWELGRVLVDTHTAYQHLVIAETAQGITLFCDNDRQSTEASQLVYHEALLIPALCLARQLDRVLIIGSTEGVLTQLALAAGVQHVDHVDIDREAVELCAQHLPYGYANLDSLGPVDLHYTDGHAFVATTPHRYDVIAIDLPDEHPGPAQHNRLYQPDFLTRCRDLLTPTGVVVSQAGCPTLWRNQTLIASWHRFHQIFATVLYYGSDEHEWAFLTGLADPTEPTPDLASIPYKPQTLDPDSLRANTIPPFHLRTS